MEELRKVRLFDISLIDFGGTAVIAAVISKYNYNSYSRHFMLYFIILIILSIFIHTSLNIETKFNRNLIKRNIVT